MQNPFKLLREIKELLIGLTVDKEFIDFDVPPADPHAVIEKIFNKGIKWFDFSELSDDKKRKYYAECQQTLNSEAINNIKNYLIATWTQECVKEFDPQNGLSVRDVQMSINGLEKFFQELDTIPDIDKAKTNKLNENNPKRFEAS